MRVAAFAADVCHLTKIKDIKIVNFICLVGMVFVDGRLEARKMRDIHARRFSIPKHVMST